MSLLLIVIWLLIGLIVAVSFGFFVISEVKHEKTKDKSFIA